MMTDTQQQLTELMSSREWRLNHLYWITNKSGQLQRFRANWAQEKLYRNLWYRNEILKVRQLGISTFVAILWLDIALFDPHKTLAIIDKRREDAAAKAEKIAMAYEMLDYIPDGATAEDQSLAIIGAGIKSSRKVTAQTKGSIEFSNGSKIYTTSSARSRTVNYLHVSELAYPSIHNPAKAREIVTGSINSVGKDGIVICESTHEGGKTGLNYERVMAAMRMIGQPLSHLDSRFFFFSWVDHPEYRLDGVTPTLTPELEDYYDQLEKNGVELDDAQKAWYAAQWRANGYATRQEYPTTPGEAFETAARGAYYSHEIAELRATGRLYAEFECADDAPLYTSWDLGMSDDTSIWLIQPRRDGRYYVLDHYRAHGFGIDHYARQINAWEASFGPVHRHLLPHDGNNRDLSSGVSVASVLRNKGFAVSVVRRTRDVLGGINALRALLRHMVFHHRCDEQREVEGEMIQSGISALETYHCQPGSREPVHDDSSHSADALRYFAEALAQGLVGKPDTVVMTRAERRKAANKRAIM